MGPEYSGLSSCPLLIAGVREAGVRGTVPIDDELRLLVLAVLFTLDPVLTREELIDVGLVLADALEEPT